MICFSDSLVSHPKIRLALLASAVKIADHFASRTKTVCSGIILFTVCATSRFEYPLDDPKLKISDAPPFAKYSAPIT